MSEKQSRGPAMKWTEAVNVVVGNDVPDLSPGTIEKGEEKKKKEEDGRKTFGGEATIWTKTETF